MSNSDWPAFKDMTGSVLFEGPDCPIELPITPTMKRIRYKGEEYFRVTNSRSHLADGTSGGLYLWAKWMPKLKEPATLLPALEERG